MLIEIKFLKMLNQCTKKKKSKKMLLLLKISKNSKIYYDALKMRFLEIADTLKVSMKYLGHIIRNLLGIRKLYEETVCSKSRYIYYLPMKTRARLHALGFEMLPYTLYFLVPQRLFSETSIA